MKFKNKKTGQIGNFIINKDHFECVDLDYVPEYRNLAELNAEWKDYKDKENLCLGRYTGFEDMNGERICEGDVLLSGERVGNVVWDNAFGEYDVEWDYDDDVDKLKDEAHCSEVSPRRSEERKEEEE